MNCERLRVWLHRGFFLALVLLFIHEYPNVQKAHDLVMSWPGYCLAGVPCPLDEANRLYNAAFARLSLAVLGLMITDKAFLNSIRILKRAFFTDWLKEDKSAWASVKFSLSLLYVLGLVAGAGMLIQNWRWLF